MPKTVATDLSWQPLGEIACLLQLAADHLWQAADTAGIDSPLHSLGLGLFLAASQATDMLPADKEVPDHSPSQSSDPLRVLEAAEQLTQQLDARVAGASDLRITIADLVREARHSAA
ncbi:hypothetical protein ACVW00_000054 [Marmoricola sp. URHA0025 HA25]